MNYWIDIEGNRHEEDDYILVCMKTSPTVRGKLLNDAVMVETNGSQFWMKPNGGGLHRIDGPAVIFFNGYQQFWVDGEVPLSIMDLLIIDENLDCDMFPSANHDQSVRYNDSHHRNHRAYRLDSHDLPLAILRYS